jgi:phosphoglycerol transferase MdoB-like AlkP superfamily enzyme
MATESQKSMIETFTGLSNQTLEILCILMIALLVVGRSIVLLRQDVPWAFMTLSSISALLVACGIFFMGGIQLYTVAMLACTSLMVITDIGVGDYMDMRKAVAWMVHALMLVAFVIVVQHKTMKSYAGDPAYFGTYVGKLVSYKDTDGRWVAGYLRDAMRNGKYAISRSMGNAPSKYIYVDKNSVRPPDSKTLPSGR